MNRLDNIDELYFKIINNRKINFCHSSCLFLFLYMFIPFFIIIIITPFLFLYTHMHTNTFYPIQCTTWRWRRRLYTSNNIIVTSSFVLFSILVFFCFVRVFVYVLFYACMCVYFSVEAIPLLLLLSLLFENIY